MKRYFCTIFNNKTAQVSAIVGSASLVLVSNAQAALPTAITTVFGTLTSAVGEVEDIVWPVIGAVLVFLTYIKLIKRGASKI